MGNKIRKFTLIAFLALTILTSGCSLTLTKNYSNGYSSREDKKPAGEIPKINYQSQQTDAKRL